MVNLFKQFPDNDGKERKAKISEGIVPWTIDNVEAYVRPVDSTDYKDWESVSLDTEVNPTEQSIRYDLKLSYKDRSNTVRYYPREKTAWKFQSVFKAANIKSGDPGDLIGQEVGFLTYKAPGKKFDYYWAVYDVVYEDEESAFGGIKKAVVGGFTKVSKKSMFYVSPYQDKVDKIKETFDAEEEDDLPF